MIRNHLYDVFQLFDYSDATVMNGNRSTSTVAPQALFMLNGQLVSRAAAAVEEMLPPHPPEQRVRSAYQRVLTREPTAREIARALAFVNAAQQRKGHTAEAWRAFCHVLLASNEFIYVR